MTSNNGNGLGISAVDAQKVVDSIREGKGAHNLGEIDLKDAILLLMTSLEHQKSIVSRTLLMKEVFLLYEEVFKPYGLSQGASDAEFFGYIYGPYSRKVNVSISLLAFSGVVKISNYHDKFHSIDGNDTAEKRVPFLPFFETAENFYSVAKNYFGLLEKKGIGIEELKQTIARYKTAWDQNAPSGVIRYVDQSKYEGYIINNSMEDLSKKFKYGLIVEEFNRSLIQKETR